MDVIEKSAKFPPEQRYFNISVLWIFYFRRVVWLLYRLRIPHELVTLASIGCGLWSALLFWHGQLIAAAVAFHFKDVFDASDGALARATGRGHLVGRYLDTVGDFVTLTAVYAAISWRAAVAGSPVFIGWGLIALISTLFQGSIFNYYQITYQKAVRGSRLSSVADERSRTDTSVNSRSSFYRILLRILHGLYVFIFSWQDTAAAGLDRRLMNVAGEPPAQLWHADKREMTWLSPLCYGTHIFVVIVFALFGRPEYGLVANATLLNLYLAVVLARRVTVFQKRAFASDPEN
jgi:phosphatidylglycerophosphate synthase